MGGARQTTSQSLAECPHDAFVNLEALDSIVSEHLQQKDHQCAVAKQVHDNILRGTIHNLPSIMAPIPCFQDPVLKFRIACQMFVELSRKGKPIEKALAFLRETLTPLAMSAYPEAWNDLQEFLLILVYPEDAENSPVKELWSDATRRQLAGQCYRLVQENQGLLDTRLVMILKYLALSAQSLIDAKPGLVTPDSGGPILEALCSQGLFYMVQNTMRRKAPHCPSLEGTCSNEYIEAVNTESHIQIMMVKSLFGLTREETWRSLKQAGCSIEKTFKHELTALPHLKPILDDLALDYAQYRDIDVPNVNVRKTQKTVAPEITDQQIRLHEFRIADSAAPIGKRDPGRSPPKKIPRLEGPNDSAEDSPRIEQRRQAEIATQHSTQSSNNEDTELQNDMRSVRVIGGLLRSGQIDEAIEAINRLEPALLKKSASLHYQLLVAKYKQLLAEDQTDSALKLLQFEINPVVKGCQDPKLEKQAQGLTNYLMCSPDAAGLKFDLGALANAVESALCTGLNLKPCSLIDLVKRLLAAHNFWLDSQMCPDYFGKFIGLKELQTGNVDFKNQAVPSLQELTKANSAAPEPNSADADIAAGEQAGLTEQKISSVMDITNLSRAVVIPMLREAGYNLETLLENLFGAAGDADMEGASD